MCAQLFMPQRAECNHCVGVEGRVDMVCPMTKPDLQSPEINAVIDLVPIHTSNSPFSRSAPVQRHAIAHHVLQSGGHFPLGSALNEP